jgi:hypothetical protein
MSMRLSNDYWNEAKSQRGTTESREKSDMGYWNEIDAKETKDIIRNDCMMTRQRDALEEAGGRFAKLTPSTVTGQSPSSQIPQQPAGSPWASNPVPPDPATDQLGFDINEVEAVELPASSADQSIGSPGDAGTAPTPSVASPASVGQGGSRHSPSAASSQPFRRRF